MASLCEEHSKTGLLTINLTADQLEEQLEKLRRRGWMQRVRNQSTNKRDELQVKTNTIELPPITKGDKAGLVSCPTPTAVLLEIVEGKTERQKERMKAPTRAKNQLPKKSIRQVKPCPPGSIVQKKKGQDSKADFVCLGMHLKDQVSANPFGRAGKDNSSNNQLINESNLQLAESNFDDDSNRLPEIQTLNGPFFRPWCKGRKEARPHTEDGYEKSDPYGCFDLKKNKCFDLKAMLKELLKIQRNRNYYRDSFLPMLKSYNNMSEITIDTAASYAARVKAARAMSSKGGGYRKKFATSVKDEVHMRTLMRQSLSSFYDLGGSLNYSERVIVDACSKKHSRLKLKYLPSLPPEGLGICPLAIPYATSPFIPISNLDLRKIYKILEEFPWYSWQPPFDPEKLDASCFNGKAVGRKLELLDRSTCSTPLPIDKTPLASSEYDEGKLMQVDVSCINETLKSELSV